MKQAARLPVLCLAIAALFATSTTQAQSVGPNSVDTQVITSEAFLSSHPDLRHRLLGLKAFKAGDHAEALSNFRRASRFGDKPSQGMVAEMLWNGMGAPANRPLAYVWMDLAAERQFKAMLIHRERYWNALSESEREQAIALGQEVFAEYSDEFAKPRLERLLRTARRNTTGSRTGFVGSLQIIIPGPSGEVTLDGSQFYQDKFWKPESYWSWQAEDWKELPKGTVEVGPLQFPAGKPAEQDAPNGK